MAGREVYGVKNATKEIFNGANFIVTPFEDSSEEIMIMVPINPNDNIKTIGKYISEKVDSIRNKKVEKALKR